VIPIALLAVALSVLRSAVVHQAYLIPLRHAPALCVPLAVIAFPEGVDAAFRRSFRARGQGISESSSIGLIRGAGWILLLTQIAVHHLIFSPPVVP